MKTKLLFVVAIIAFILICLAYVGLYMFYNEYQKRTVSFEDQNKAVNMKIANVESNMGEFKDLIVQLNGKIKDYGEILTGMEDKVKLSASEVESLKKNMETWQADLADINKRLETVGGNMKQVELGSVSVDKAAAQQPAVESAPAPVSAPAPAAQ